MIEITSFWTWSASLTWLILSSMFLFDCAMLSIIEWSILSFYVTCLSSSIYFFFISWSSLRRKVACWGSMPNETGRPTFTDLQKDLPVFLKSEDDDCIVSFIMFRDLDPRGWILLVEADSLERPVVLKFSFDIVLLIICMENTNRKSYYQYGSFFT